MQEKYDMHMMLSSLKEKYVTGNNTDYIYQDASKLALLYRSTTKHSSLHMPCRVMII